MITRKFSSESELEEYKKIYDIAIGSNYGDSYFPKNDHPLENVFGCFVEEELVSVLHIIDYKAIKIRKHFFKMGGIEGVVTRPGYRGRGHLKQLFKHVFHELKSRGQFISVLFPIYHPVYEHIGFGLADEHIFYQFKLNNIKQKRYSNRVFKIVENITEDFKEIYTKSTEDYNYIARRYESEWELKSTQVDFKVLCHDENMNPVGYCLLKFLKGHYLFKNPSETLHISEAFWLDKTTKHAIFQDFLYSFRDQREYGSVVLPINENLIELLIDPVIETRTIKPSSRIRLVNVREILSKMNYSLKDFNLVLRIHDTYCDWNDNTFIMKSENGNVEMTIDTKTSLVDLETSVSRMAELVVGNRSIYELEEFEDVYVNPDLLDLINRLFPKQVNFFRDFF